jgi:hypothetical protein
VSPFSVKGYGWFLVSGPAIIKIFMDYWPMIRFWLLASRPRILPPKPQVLKYPANHIRILDQADDPHLRAALRAGQGIKKEVIHLVLKADKAYLGFCLGHQLLADALKARIGPNFCRSVGFIM